MKEQEEGKFELNKNVKSQRVVKKVDDRDEISRLLFFRTEENAEQASYAKLDFKTETRETLGGEKFTLVGLEDEFKRYVAEKEKDYEPKFSLFFKRLGRLCSWSDEEMSRFSKPRIAPITINEVIYRRFPDGLLDYMHAHNRYIGYCVRRTKNYKLLNEDGIRKLEVYIDEANSLMPECEGYYDFRVKMYENFQVPYQMQLFPELR